MRPTSRKGANLLLPVDALVGGHEALHWSAAGDPEASDAEICSFARANGCIVLTNDLDFPQILAHTRQRQGVVLLRGEPLTPEVRSVALLKTLQDCATELMQGAIVSLDWSGPHARKSSAAGFTQ